jgi:hypothetical protein
MHCTEDSPLFVAIWYTLATGLMVDGRPAARAIRTALVARAKASARVLQLTLASVICAEERMQSGFEAASRSLAEANKGFQALAAEMMEYSKAAFDDAIRTWEQLIGVRTLEAAVAIQSDYAKRIYENHMAELKKLGEMCVGMVRDASKPVEDVSRKFR